MEATARPDLLARLVHIARERFGFFPSHYHNTIGCPWVARMLEDLPRNSRMLDIGTGVSALPVFLGERGAIVDCVDSHPIIRTPPPGADWNEWGFFDYGRIHPNLTAYHCEIADFTPHGNFDAIYSVAAIAHMPRSARENAFERCRILLRPGGMLLLTVDLIPSSDFLWNRREGQELEPRAQHGTIADVSRELTGLGFELNHVRVHRMLPASRTDLLFIHCTLTDS
jgi:SAM-dependent methyltransferase